MANTIHYKTLAVLRSSCHILDGRQLRAAIAHLIKAGQTNYTTLLTKFKEGLRNTPALQQLTPPAFPALAEGELHKDTESYDAKKVSPLAKLTDRHLPSMSR